MNRTQCEGDYDDEHRKTQTPNTRGNTASTNYTDETGKSKTEHTPMRDYGCVPI